MCTAQDAALPAAGAGVVDVDKAMDVADDGTVVARVCSNAAGVLNVGVNRSVDAEVLDEAVGRDDTKETVEVLGRFHIEVLDDVALSVEVSLEASTAVGSSGPVADRRPGPVGSLDVGKVDVGHKLGLGLEIALVHQQGKPPELVQVANLVDAVGICRQGVAAIEEVAIGAISVGEVMLVLRHLGLGVGIGCICIDIAVTVLPSVHEDLSVSWVEHRGFVGTHRLEPTNL